VIALLATGCTHVEGYHSYEGRLVDTSRVRVHVTRPGGGPAEVLSDGATQAAPIRVDRHVVTLKRSPDALTALVEDCKDDACRKRGDGHTSTLLRAGSTVKLTPEQGRAVAAGRAEPIVQPRSVYLDTTSVRETSSYSTPRACARRRASARATCSPTG
jgi:hypothetical protein